MKQTRFHVMGLAHQAVTKRVTSCAYTAKVFNMCVMLKNAGHEVFLYHAGSIVQRDIATKTIQVVEDDTLVAKYGDKFFETFNQTWDQNDEAWVEFRRNTSLAIGKNLSDEGDIVLASFGLAQQSCCPSPSSALTIEMGIGYEGVFCSRKVWESYAWRHFVYGKYPHLMKQFDVVIPGYYNPNDFSYEEKKQDYFLYLGRVLPEKGVAEAAEAAKLAGVKLKLVGTGDPEWISKNCPDAEYVGIVDATKRRKFLSEARGLICFTQYVEPFGNVAVEAMASGTPVISSDWGAFTETVIHGRTGYRCSDIAQIVTAIGKVNNGEISPSECGIFARNFTNEMVWPRYEQYFEYQKRLFGLEFGYKL